MSKPPRKSSIFFWTLTAAVLITGLTSRPAKAIVYGTDDRSEANETWASHWSRAVFLMAPRTLTRPGAVTTALDFPIISRSESPIGLCEAENFSKQPSAGMNCTGFLVAPDLLVTAGHCVIPSLPASHPEVRRTEPRACRDFVWIADYAFGRGMRSLATEAWPSDNVFECAEVVRARNPDFSNPALLPPNFGDDYAVVRLNRKTTNRPFFRISESAIPLGPIYALGHPLGLPLKLSGPARVLDSTYRNFFATNIDTAMGNSGSPVFDATGKVFGILTRGYPEDFLRTIPKTCYSSNSCSEDGSKCVQNTEPQFPIGEHIQRGEPVVLTLRELGVPGYESPFVAGTGFILGSRFGPPATNVFGPSPYRLSKELQARKARPRTFVNPDDSSDLTIKR